MPVFRVEKKPEVSMSFADFVVMKDYEAMADDFGADLHQPLVKRVQGSDD